MANPTQVLINSYTVGSGGTATVSFTSIPSTYTDLLLKVSARAINSIQTAEFHFAFNGSTTGFTERLLSGSGSGVSSGTYTLNYGGDVNGGGTTANTFGSIEMYIPNYTSSNYKSFNIDGVTENNGTTAYSNLVAEIWANTAAISQIDFTLDSSYSFAQYSTFSLYGIKNS